MDKNSIWKWIILIGLTAWSISVVTPFDKKVRKGIDLAGGSRFVLEVDTSTITPDAARDAQGRALEVIRNRIDSMGIAEPVIYTEPGNRIVVEVPGMNPSDRDQTLKNLQSAAFLEFRMVHAKNEEYVDKLFEQGLAPAGYKIVEATDMGRNGKYLQYDQKLAPSNMTESIARDHARSFEPHPGYELLMEKVEVNNQTLYRPYFVSKKRDLTGEALKDASIDYDQVRRPYVRLAFNSQGAKLFGNLTKDYAPGGAQNPGMNTQRQLAIVLDGTLYSAPSIREPILGGNAQITGNFTVEESQNLAIVLRAGALPAPVKLLEERTVAATLGDASIKSGQRATLIGCAAIFIFMAIYYTLAGCIADIALIMNLVLLPLSLIFTAGLFSMISAEGGRNGALGLPTLTLPGIAGIALTIGMAVDANVLIYERMREEMAAGKRFKAVIAAGYDRAFSAIFDSHVTALVSGAILFWMGTGPVRGYAVTLAAGLILSLYTSLVVTRMIFDFVADKGWVQTVKMLHVIKATNFDFLGKKAIFISISVLIIAATWGVLLKKGKENFGVDFTGGAAITYTFEQRVPEEQARAALAAAGIAEATVQYQKIAGKSGPGSEYLEVKVASADSLKTTSTLKSTFTSAGLSVAQEDNVGPLIGAELKKKAIIAMILSIIGIAVYISLRFEFPFAMGALLSLFHDVFMGVGIYCALGYQLNVSMVAAVLTVVGYSVNDTIVIFDRIRENMKLYPGRNFYDVANDSINQTLGRTIWTTFTTLLSVVSLLLFGGGAIREFVLLLFIGMLSGVYSTIYIATPMVLLFHPDASKLRGNKAQASAKAVPAKAS